MEKARILVVEDEAVSRQLLLDLLTEEGYHAVAAENGTAAWQRLSAPAETFDLVLLDRLMPDMDGIEVLRRLRAEPERPQPPVIMQTSLTAAADVAAGLAAGAYYYLTKPFAPDTLLAIMAAALRDHLGHRALREQVRRSARTLGRLERAEFSFRTVDEARDIAALLAATAPAADTLVVGLSELLVNAVEHGNLAIGYREKSRLMAADRLDEELARRLASPEYGGRRAAVAFHREPGRLRFLIRDQGSGFDWNRYLEMSPERAFDLHGRGIALARAMSFDSLRYLGRGNEVEATVAIR